MRRTPALLAIAGVIAGLVLAELAARLILPDPRGPQMQWSTPEDVERRAGEATSDGPYGSFTYDEHGFRVGSGLPADQNVLFIGDSFTEGFGVSDDQTFARATERALRRDGFQVRSLNAGHRGFGAAQELSGFHGSMRAM